MQVKRGLYRLRCAKNIIANGGVLCVNRVFGAVNPRLAIGDIRWGRFLKYIPVPKFGMAQRHYLIVQEYIDVETEWRIIKIGDTYAGYKRPTENGRASCEKMEYGFPPKELLSLIKRISTEERFDSLSMDVLVDKEGKFYVTELQSLYGSFSMTQCAVDGVSGRIVEKDGEFVFEAGEDYFKYNSNVLRVSDFVKKLKNGYYK